MITYQRSKYIWLTFEDGRLRMSALEAAANRQCWNRILKPKKSIIFRNLRTLKIILFANFFSQIKFFSSQKQGQKFNHNKIFRENPLWGGSLGVLFYGWNQGRKTGFGEGVLVFLFKLLTASFARPTDLAIFEKFAFENWRFRTGVSSEICFLRVSGGRGGISSSTMSSDEDGWRETRRTTSSIIDTIEDFLDFKKNQMIIESNILHFYLFKKKIFSSNFLMLHYLFILLFFYFFLNLLFFYSFILFKNVNRNLRSKTIKKL